MEPRIHQCQTKICISESTRRRYSQLSAVYNDIKSNRCGLEIVGVSNLSFNQLQENDAVILAVKITFESWNSASNTIPSTQPEPE